VRAESPDLVLAKRLLDELKLRGFEFRRAAPGVDGPLVGNRINGGSADLIHIDGFSRGCFARRQRTSSLIVPGGALVERQVQDSAVPHARHQVLKVDVRSGTVIDADYAAALVAVRTPLPLAEVRIVKIMED
jgi:hypothetical protein